MPTTWQLKDEAYSILVAASETTGAAMSAAAFHVLYDPKIYNQLASELRKKFPDPETTLPLRELEQLPYLVSTPPFHIILE